MATKFIVHAMCSLALVITTAISEAPSRANATTTGDDDRETGPVTVTGYAIGAPGPNRNHQKSTGRMIRCIMPAPQKQGNWHHV